MVWWRFKRSEPGPYRFGYMTQLGNGLVRMGNWNGDTHGGTAVKLSEIEYEDYQR